MKKYSKPVVVAKNLPTGSYAGGCPVKDTGGKQCMVLSFVGDTKCKVCERSR